MQQEVRPAQGARSPIRVFVSHARRDARSLDQLERHLAPLVRNRTIQLASDRSTLPGEAFEARLHEESDRADVMVALMTADWLASEWVQSVELARALELVEAGRLRVLPLIGGPCDWESSPIGRYQPLPRSRKPIESSTDQDKGWAEVVRESAGS